MTRQEMKDLIKSEDFKKQVLQRIKNDNVDLQEFNEQQQQEIIKTYAATLLNNY